MKHRNLHLSLVIILLIPMWSKAERNPYWQEPTKAQVDSLKQLLRETKDDTIRMYANRQLGLFYQEIHREISLSYFEEHLVLAKTLKQRIWEAEALSRIGYVSSLLSNYSGSIKSLLNAREIASDRKAEKGMLNVTLFSNDGDPFRARMMLLGSINQHLGILYFFTGDFKKALEYYSECIRINETIRDDAFMSLVKLNIGESYRALGKLDSAKLAFNEALRLCEASGYEKFKSLLFYGIGDVCVKERNFTEAKKYFNLSVQTSFQQQSLDFLGMGHLALSDAALSTGNVDSSFFYAKKTLETYVTINDTIGLTNSYSALSSSFAALNQTDSAYYYLNKSTTLKAALNKEGRVKIFQAIGFNEQIKLQALEAEKMRTQSRTTTYSLVAGIGFLLLLSSIFYRNNKQQKKAKANIEKAYTELKSTQSLLIQSEKMASLGELTAGIAHEIQNPLNFVNNFSEVSNDLLNELNEEIQKGNFAEVKAITDDVRKNLEKILHHGKRADGIVKGMLQHSRSSAGVKEPTDINALTDEYLRLAFHGFRAKDKAFNVITKTDFDERVGKVAIVPQDIGRVVLNLISNAFYAVSERKIQSAAKYEPTVTLTTKRQDNHVLISIKDNGNGIPQKILDKIFQPFFTTKPTGQGTGLGLSLSYDIVKAHGGELGVKTTEGEGSEFTISIRL